MTLQNIFFVVGIICMTLYTLLLVAVVVLLFYIKKKISDLTENIQEKIDLAKEVITHPQNVAASVGAAVADTAISKAVEFINHKKKKYEKE